MTWDTSGNDDIEISTNHLLVQNLTHGLKDQAMKSNIIPKFLNL